MARPPAQRVLPRLSASQLADYLVAPTPIGQMGILRQAKNPGPNRPLIIQYQHARRTIAECLRDRGGVNRIAAGAVIAYRVRAREDDRKNGIRRDNGRLGSCPERRVQAEARSQMTWNPELQKLLRQEDERRTLNTLPVSAPDLPEVDHFYACDKCGQAVDRRRLGDVIHHEMEEHERLRVE